jgi:predicted dehydrogenase
VRAKDLAAPYDDPLTELRGVLLFGAKADGLTSLKTNLVAMEILDAARTSAAAGRSIPLPLKK